MPYFIRTIAILEAIAATEVTISTALIVEAAGELGINAPLDIAATNSLAMALASEPVIAVAGVAVAAAVAKSAAAHVAILGIYASEGAIMAGEAAANVGTVA